MTVSTSNTRKQLSATDIVYCAMFVALMAIGAKIHIMLPLGVFEVTVSLQVFFAVMAGLLIGPWRGFISVLVYLLIGLLGVPIFAHGGGLQYMAKPTFGFLIGFAFAALVAGLVMKALKKRTVVNLVLAAFLAEMAYYAAGLIYYFVMFNFILPGNSIGVAELMSVWFLSTVIPDFVICAAAALLSARLIPALGDLIK